VEASGQTPESFTFGSTSPVEESEEEDEIELAAVRQKWVRPNGPSLQQWIEEREALLTPEGSPSTYSGPLDIMGVD